MTLYVRVHVIERKVSSMQKAFHKLVNDSEIINLNIKSLGSHANDIEKLVENEFKFNKLLRIIPLNYLG